MSFRERMTRKLWCSFCDKPDINRRALRLRKCFAEADRALNGRCCGRCGKHNHK